MYYKKFNLNTQAEVDNVHGVLIGKYNRRFEHHYILVHTLSATL